jgi:LCP family protein required for cell wall assembly
VREHGQGPVPRRPELFPGPGRRREGPPAQPLPAGTAPVPGRLRPRPSRPPPGRRSPAAGRLAACLAATRKARRQRVFLIAASLLSAGVLVLAGAAWGVTGYLNGAVARVDAGTAGGYRGPLNVLLAGVDLRAGLTPRQQRELHVGHVVSANSDTMMLIHISASRTRVTVVSLPRDSWVHIPGHGMGKINSAFGLGGPRLMVATVEHLTGLTINHYIEVNFLGFVKVIDALGGVDICLPFPVNDPYSGLHLSAGRHHVNGITALKYARDRHSFATSDLARISHQQSLLASLLREAISSHTLTDPLRLASFLHAVLGVIKVDRGLDLAALADQLRGITLADVQFLTVPLANPNYTTPGGLSAVLWNYPAAHRIFAALKADRPLGGSALRARGRPGHHGRHLPGQPRPAGPAVRPPPGTRTAAQAACR